MAERRLVVAVFNEAAGWVLPDAMIQRLREGAPPDVAVERVESRETLLDRLPEADYLFGLPLAVGQLAGRIPKLKWIQLTGSAGESRAVTEAPLDRRIAVTGAATVRAPQTAEHAVALTLTLLRRLDGAVSAQQDRRWASAELASDVRDLEGATAGVVGIGLVGEQIARRLGAFGCEIIATPAQSDEHSAQEEGTDQVGSAVDRLLSADRLDELLARSDVVIVADAPPRLAPPVLGRAELQQFKRSAVLVNVAAPAARHADLTEALRKRRLAGAALDAFEREPLPADSPLWTTPGVVVSPRLASASPRYWERAVDLTLENLRRVEAGQDLRERINFGEPADVGTR